MRACVLSKANVCLKKKVSVEILKPFNDHSILIFRSSSKGKSILFYCQLKGINFDGAKVRLNATAGLRGKVVTLAAAEKVGLF